MTAIFPLYVDAIGTATPLAPETDVVMAGVTARRSAFGPVTIRYNSGYHGPVLSPEGAPLVGSQLVDAAVDDRERLLQLAAMALKPCITPDPQGPLALVLALPADALALAATTEARGARGLAPRETPEQRWQNDFMRDLNQRLGGSALDAAHSRILWGDRPAIAQALTLCGERLRATRRQACYVGACDSTLRFNRLLEGLRAGRVKMPNGLTGSLPGEGAAVLRVSLRRGASNKAQIVSASWRQPPEQPAADAAPAPNGPPPPLPGAALLATCREALRQAAITIDNISAFSHDAAGELAHFEQIALAAARLRPTREQTFDRWTPALSFGETGTASGALAVAYDAYALGAGWTAGPCVLHIAAGQDGSSGAVVVRSLSAGQQKNP